MKINRFFSLILLLTGSSIFAETKSTLSSTSTVNWNKLYFNSSVSLDTQKAGITLPSGKKAAANKIEMELPILIKDPLLSLYVSSDQQLGDMVFNETITLEQLTDIISECKRTPGVFAEGTTVLQMQHIIDLKQISSLMIKHHIPYKNTKPIKQISSRPYTGIIIDARGSLPVHGEFISDKTYPCFFPIIWNENMDTIYERNMGSPELEKQQGMILYDWSDDESRYNDRIGVDPMHITARKVYGQFRTDPVISNEDALRILTVPENMNLLRDGKVVILVEKENLIRPVSSPEKSESYYTAYRTLREYLHNNTLEEPEIEDTFKGIQIRYDLKFAADSATLLDTELPKIKLLADSLKKINENNAFTILVEGHTADINKPDGQMQLSVERTQSIIRALVANGLDSSIFTFKGYGGTKPIASNETPEGRAQNRRVIITAQPKATYIKKQ